MQIEIVSPVECRVLRKDGEKLRSCLSFSAYYYVQKQYKKECKDYQKYVFSQITDTHYYFWFGLLTRVKRFCKSKGIKYEINGNIRSWELSPPQKLHVPGIEFRKEQVNLIQSAILKRRGVIKAPTGSGKTILQLGIISCWREHKCLLLAHTLDIISQTVREIEEKFNCEVGVFAEGKKQTDKLITVATIQSVGNPIMLYKELINVMGKSSDINWWKQKEEIQKGNLNLLVEHTNFKSSTQLIKSKTPEAVTARKIAKEIKKCEHAINILPNCKKIEEGAKVVLDFLAENEIVIVDEAHHISKIDGAYAHALSHCFAPVRLGFTATLPTEEEAKFSLEGLLGPLIQELTINEAGDLGILAKPKIKIIRTPYNHEIDHEYNYAKAYDIGIVSCRKRNELIINTAIDYINEGKNLLIIVSKIAHGENLISCAYDICNISKREFNSYFRFIQGKTTSDERNLVKEALKSKKTSCVIATTIWCEGIDIPSLDCVINAAGGKSEIRTLQVIGRGLRKTDTKDTVIIVDIFDPHSHHLIRHFGERLDLYFKNNWI